MPAFMSTSQQVGTEAVPRSWSSLQHRALLCKPFSSVVTFLCVLLPPSPPDRQHVLPGVAALPPVLRDAAVLGVLRALPQLGAQDRAFSAWLRQVPFVPNNKVRAVGWS